MNGGYFMINCGGLDVSSDETQNIPGLNAKVKDAYEKNKPCIAEGCYFGDYYMTPISIMINPLPGTPTTFVCTASTLQIRVDSSDNVTVVNMAPSVNAKKSTK